MKLLLPIARRILLPPVVVFSVTAVYQYFSGEVLEIRENVNTLIFLSGGVLAVWAPLPFAQYCSSKFSRWQSLIRLFFGVVFAAISFGFYIYLVIHFDLYH